MLATIRQQEQRSFYPAIKFMRASQDQIIDHAENDGILKDLFEYLKQHPKLMGFVDGSSSSTVKTPSSTPANGIPSSSGGEAECIPVEESVAIAIEGQRKEMVQSTVLVQRSSVKPILPHEILLKIADYISDGDDFINWVTALTEEKYPTVGDLSLILDLQQKTGLESGDMWPCLEMHQAKATRVNALSLSKVSHFFRSIVFSNSYPPKLIRVAVPSLKPVVSAKFSLPRI